MGRTSRVAGEPRSTNSVEKNLRRVKLSHGIQQDRRQVLKMKTLIEKYKEAKEWNRKQSGRGSKRKSILFDEIGAILGCRGIVTLSNVSEAGTSASSSPSNTSSSSSSTGSPVGSDDVDEQSNKKKSVGELTKKKRREEREEEIEEKKSRRL